MIHYIYRGKWSLYFLCTTMAEHQDTLAWEPMCGFHPNVPWCYALWMFWSFLIYIYEKWLKHSHYTTMTQHQGTIEWDSHMDPTLLCLGVVSLLYSVSVMITPIYIYIYITQLYPLNRWVELINVSLRIIRLFLFHFIPS
jgi:hypothetical protein